MFFKITKQSGFPHPTAAKSLNKIVTKRLTIFLWCLLSVHLLNQFNALSAQILPAPGQTMVEKQTLPYRQCWKLSEPNLTTNNIASDNVSTIYISTSDGKLTAVNILTGDIEWASELGGKIISAALFDEINKSLYIITKSQTSVKLRSLNKMTGVTNWQIIFENNFLNEMQSAELFLIHNRVIVSGQNGSLAAVNPADGAISWAKSINTGLSARPFFSENNLYLATAAELFIISTENGESVYRKTVPSPVTAIFAGSGGFLFLGNKKGEVAAFKVSGDISKSLQKSVWKIRTGAEITNLIQVPNGLLITSLDNFLYLLEDRRGNRIWKKRLDGRNAADPLIIGSSAVITTVGNTAAMIINLSDGKTINQILSEPENYFTTRSVMTDGIIIFPILQGLSAFSSSPERCSVP